MKKGKKKILFVAHMDSHIANFHLPYLKWFQENGYETHVASNSEEKSKEIMYVDVKHQINFKRSPFSLKNIKAYKEFKKLIKKEGFSLVHAHTPMGGLIARRAFRKTKVPVFYTAHGFHFLKGGSKLSYLLFYPIEKYLSKFTTELITINSEDYNLAKSKFGKRTNVSLINGVGVDLNEYKKSSEESLVKLKEELKIKETDFIITYVAEHTKGKNQKFLIEVFKEIIDRNNNVKLLLLGYGKELENNKTLIKELNLENNILVLGFRNDINDILNISNLVTSSSLREGLPKAILEALAASKPLLVSDVRGNRDLVSESNGFIFNVNDKEDYINKFYKLYNNQELLIELGKNSHLKSKDYDIEIVLNKMVNLYKKYL